MTLLDVDKVLEALVEAEGDVTMLLTLVNELKAQVETSNARLISKQQECYQLREQLNTRGPNINQ